LAQKKGFIPTKRNQLKKKAMGSQNQGDPTARRKEKRDMVRSSV